MRILARQRHERTLGRRFRGFGRFAGQDVDRLFAHHDLPAAGREDRQQADRLADAAHLVPGNPNAVGGAQLGGREVLGELLRRKNELAAGRLGWLAILRIIVAIDDQLALDGHGLVLRVVEVQPPAESASWPLARLGVHGLGPDGDHPHRKFVLALLDFLILAGDRQLVRDRAQPGEFHALAAGEERECQRG